MSAYVDFDIEEEPVANAVLSYIFNDFRTLGNKLVSDCVVVNRQKGCIQIAGKEVVRVGSNQEYNVNFGPGLAVGISPFTDIMSTCCQKRLCDLTKDDDNCRETDELHMFSGDFAFDSD